jgi:hypothetical protein
MNNPSVNATGKNRELDRWVKIGYELINRLL